MLLKEYKIPMPLSVEEYSIGQLYMIAKVSNEQSQANDGVEIVHNYPVEDPVHGKGQFTEKRVYLSSKLPSFLQSMLPKMCCLTEKAWNFFPYTKTEYKCSVVPLLSIVIETRYEDNCGSSENALSLTKEDLDQREIDIIDIVTDTYPAKHYKETEDLTKWKSEKCNRGPYTRGWTETALPIMCSYKVVRVCFEVWGLQTRVESFVHKMIRDILVVGHRQAVAWMDEWQGMTVEEVRMFEKQKNDATNEKMRRPADLEKSVT